MTLREYIEARGTTATDFAEILGMPQGTVSRYVRGERIPEPDAMAAIFALTGGRVTPNDFYALSVDSVKPVRATA